MSGAKSTINSSKGQSTLARARFGPGMLLHHDDLEQLNTYTRELNRLMFRSLFGCGVICGLVVKTDQKCGKVYVTVGAGLALDCAGDPVYVPKDHRLAIDEECDQNIPSPLWVVLCGTTKCCAPRTSMCASDEDEAPSVCTRERDGFEIRIMSEPPRCVCHCPEVHYSAPPRETERRCGNRDNPCYFDHYDGKCGCSCGDCSDCECVLLARLDKIDDERNPWSVDHRVRRFIRPEVMPDPEAEREEAARREVELARRQTEEAANATALREAKKPAPKASKAAKPAQS